MQSFPSADGPVATETTASETPAPNGVRRSRMWIVLIVVVLVVAAAGGAYAWLRPDPGPVSVQALAELLADLPGDHTGVVDRSDIVANARTGLRWGASLAWAGPDGNGIVTLYQYRSTAFAATALAVSQQVTTTNRPVAGMAQGFIGTTDVNGQPLIIADGVKGVVLVDVNSSSGTEAFAKQVLLAQLNRLT
jgi:hypothetical protein